MLFPVPGLFTSAFGQINSWTKPTSGNWEELYWSMGVRPAPGHRVMIDNPGWKAVQIWGNTVQNFPSTLTVYLVNIASPVDSYNTLLLRQMGYQRPLTVTYSLTVGTGAALTMEQSALHLGGPTGVGLSVGGIVNHDQSSQVTGNQVDVGWVGPGVYNLNSGILQVEHLWVGGPNVGTFNHNGGTNAARILHLTGTTTYNLKGGDLTGEIYFDDSVRVQQEGGRMHRMLSMFRGEYVLNNGLLYGGVRIPVYAEYSKGSATAIQNGGTNAGPIYLGGEQGGGAYTLNGGVINAPEIQVGMDGELRITGGRMTCTNEFVVTGSLVRGGGTAYGYASLTGGTITSPTMSAFGPFGQSGGTNNVLGELRAGPTIYYTRTSYILQNGTLNTENTRVTAAWGGGFIQRGGVHRIAKDLTVGGGGSPFPRGYVLEGGQLIVSNIVVTVPGSFEPMGGTVAQSGRLTLMRGFLVPGEGTHQFGSLKLGASGSDTNSSIHMPTNSGVVIRLANSSGVPWDAGATLTISNWNGSYLGGGGHRIIFGNSASALTPQQVARIFFRDPGGGLSPGLHPSKILPTGEIVPDSVPPTGRTPPRLTVRKVPAGVEIIVRGEAGYEYGVLRSFDLNNWTFWASRVATNGTMSMVDSDLWPPSRYYKAVLMR